jgi:hypothetical protein
MTGMASTDVTPQTLLPILKAALQADNAALKELHNADHAGMAVSLMQVSMYTYMCA